MSTNTTLKRASEAKHRKRFIQRRDEAKVRALPHGVRATLSREAVKADELYWAGC